MSIEDEIWLLLLTSRARTVLLALLVAEVVWMSLEVVESGGVW